MLFRILLGYFSAKKQLRSCNQVVIQGQPVFINKYIQSPLSFGLPKSKIYFPLDAETKWTSREIQMILAHENFHVERNDSLWKLLSLIVQAILFFAPWMYYLHRRFELEMEVVCDLKTCKKTGADIQEYGNFLLAMTCAQPQNLIFTNMTDSTLKRRLLAMKSKTVNSRLLVFILSLVILLGGSTAIGMTSGIKEKNFFIIKTKIIVDGKLVSSPEILAKENQKASITLTNNTDNSGTQGLRMQLMAQGAVRNDAIEINYDIEYKNGKEEIRTNPQIIVVPNQEAEINLSSDSKHSYKMLVVAKRQ
ncbi:MAG: M56 family metallopeptidase [Gammaproteobacteria bacterium]|nr:M56 family metallopeptidase [Gammaproteobacteria bacterium]